MSRMLWLLCAITAAFALTACGGKTEDAGGDKAGDKAEETAEASADDKAGEKAAEEPAKEAAPAYSKEAMAKLLEQVNGCEYDFNCDAFEKVVAFGDKGHEDLIAFVEDTTKNAKGRKVAVSALVKTDAKGTAERLLAVAQKIEGFDRGDYYKAVGTLGAGNAAIFEKVKAEYLGIDSSIKRIPVGKALAGMPELTMKWAVADFGKDPEMETGIATMVTKVATDKQVEDVKAMLGKATDQMAKHRLAQTAIKLGDKSHFPVFVAGLESADQYDRSDAANFLADVAKDAPDDVKAKLVELLKAGMAKDKGGLTARGYKKSLKALGAE